MQGEKRAYYPWPNAPFSPLGPSPFCRLLGPKSKISSILRTPFLYLHTFPTRCSAISDVRSFKPARVRLQRIPYSVLRAPFSLRIPYIYFRTHSYRMHSCLRVTRGCPLPHRTCISALVPFGLGRQERDMGMLHSASEWINPVLLECMEYGVWEFLYDGAVQTPIVRTTRTRHGNLVSC